MFNKRIKVRIIFKYPDMQVFIMFLTPKQQLFIIHLLEKPIIEKKQHVYHKRHFREYVEPLIDKDLVRERETNNGSVFILTWKGNIIARFLAGLLEGNEFERFEKYAII